MTVASAAAVSRAPLSHSKYRTDPMEALNGVAENYVSRILTIPEFTSCEENFFDTTIQKSSGDRDCRSSLPISARPSRACR